MTVTSTASPTDASTASDARDRKLEHIQLSLDARMQLDARYFDQLHFVHEALPEIDLDAIDTSTTFLGKPLRAPILISCMTGGTDRASAINRHLAEAAERTGVALGVGSQRKALEDPATAATFEVRAHAPTVPVIGNLGAVQLNYGCDLDSCREAVAMVGADALALHLNPLQEALQPEGDVDFSDLLPKIGDVAAGLDVPVIAKEVGSGIAPSTARALRDHGVTWIDVAGLGGTSWARIEAARREDVALGELFAGWGIPTPQAIRDLAALDGIAVIGSGGVRSGVDVAKALALGAELVGLAQPFLAPAIENADAVVEAIERLVRTLRIAMFCVGARDLAALRQMPLVARAPWSPFDGAPVNAHTISHPFSSTSQPGTEP